MLIRMVLSILLSIFLGASFGPPQFAFAAPIPSFSTVSLLFWPGPMAKTSPDVESSAWMQEMEKTIIPKIEEILTPEQEELFQAALDKGETFRKSFKSLTLTPEQKDTLKTVLKELPKKDAFAALPPEQKKDFFMKKKQLFMPTTEEITEKIKAGMSAKEGATATPEAISEKISAKMKMVQERATTMMPEEISEKIGEKMKLFQTKGAD